MYVPMLSSFIWFNTIIIENKKKFIFLFDIGLSLDIDVVWMCGWCVCVFGFISPISLYSHSNIFLYKTPDLLAINSTQLPFDVCVCVCNALIYQFKLNK